MTCDVRRAVPVAILTSLMGYSGNDCNHGRKAAALPTRVLNELFTNNMAPAGESYGSWTLARLKAELRKRGAKTSGRKHELVKR